MRLEGVLSDLELVLEGLPPETQRQIDEDALELTRAMRFVPLPGPQTDAYLNPADILLYGGQAGGGKTGLLVGLAQEHTSSILFRREASQTDGLEKFGKQVFGSEGFNGKDTEWTFEDGSSLKLSGMKEPDSWNKHAGRERDYFGFDEAGEFLLEQVASLIGWNRGPEGQRCRVILASNPPRTADGAWMMEWFAPWLDENWPDKAKPGELRYAVLNPDTSLPIWQEGPEEVTIGGELYKPLSFTFIPASLEDNPYRNTPEYRARLNSLPEPLRSQLLKGIFTLGGEDDPWQAIPTAWLNAAISRWMPTPPQDVPMCCIGADVAQGGADQTVLAIRHDGWYAPLVAVPGVQTPGGTDVAGLLIAKRRDNAMVVIDIGGGWGGDAYAHLSSNGVKCMGYLGVDTKVSGRTSDKQLNFFNTRAKAYWKFREALNPDQPGGSRIALPNDKQLMADLSAPHFDVVSNGIKLEPKDAIVKRLGRSPDRGDAVVMAWYSGAKMEDSYRKWSTEPGGRKRSISVDLGPRRANGRR